MSTNLHLINPAGKCACKVKNHKFDLMQIPSHWTRAALPYPEFKNREYTFQVYSNFVYTRLDKKDADQIIRATRAFLDTHPKARFCVG